jgi:probable blue pigment (indigoidine) exporter
MGPVALTTLLAPVAWGTTYWVVTELMPADRPLFIAATRVVPAGLLLVAIGVLTSGWRPRGREWRHVALLSLANFGLFFPLLVAATYRVPGGVIASFAGLQPLLVLAGAWLVAGAAPRRLDVGVGVLAAVGVVLVVGIPGGTLDPLGLLLALGANVSFAVGVVLTRHLPMPPDRIAHTGWQLVLSGLVMVPLALLIEGVPTSVTGPNLLGILYLGIIATGIASVLWFNGIPRLPVAAPPLLGLSSAVTGVVVGWVALGQSLTLLQSAGFLVTLAAIAYGATRSDTSGSPSRWSATHGRWRRAPRTPRPLDPSGSPAR